MSFFGGVHEQSITLILLCLASFRVYLELVGFRFSKLPLTKMIGGRYGLERMERFHQMGLYFSIGFIILFAPGFL